VIFGAPLPPKRRESGKALRERLLREGYTRLLDADGQLFELGEQSAREFARQRDGALLIIDRLTLKPDEARARSVEAVANGFAWGGGEVVVVSERGERTLFREGFRCDRCGRSLPAPEPALFSFNSPLGACETCQGFGRVAALDVERLVPDPECSIAEGAVAPFQTRMGRSMQRDLLAACEEHGIPADRPWKRLSARHRELVIEGDDGDWYGIRGFFDWLEARRYRVQARVLIARYRRFDPCPDCRETRLRPEALAVTVAGTDIGALSRATIGEIGDWLERLHLEGEAAERSARIIEVLTARVATAREVGLDYLALERQMRTLSGGEAQRIQLARALGGTLTATLYVLDEPSVGLHARDVARLLAVLRAIRDHGNTVVVVEHAPEIIAAADFIIDLGPGPGRDGGQIVAAGDLDAIRGSAASLTGRVLRGEFRQRPRRAASAKTRRDAIRIVGATAHNLKGIDVEIPLSRLVCVTGVSGAGKSSLVRSVLVGHLQRDPERGPCEAIEGGEAIEEVVLVDPSPPVRSARSNPATLSKAFDAIRRQFAATREARAQGLAPGFFSFNVAGGRCEQCEGAGEVVVDMQFLEDLRVPCEHCDGTRYKPEARRLRLRGRSIVEVLAMTLDEAVAFFPDDRSVTERLRPYVRVGLGYLTLGQPLSTLSGGESQRLRIAGALSTGAEGTLFVLDEPTTGLHPADVEVLLACLDELIEGGGSVLLVEHNLDVIRRADWVIDLGPEGGPGGGQLIAQGRPAQIAQNKRSLTGAAVRGEFD
jgi:excinuclease ABC subunit A